MKSKLDEESRRILLILKLDAQRLFERIKFKKEDYLRVFAMKRTREHFAEVFENRYSKTTMDDLKHCSEEVIIILDKFYSCVDELFWYLSHTEEMPGTVDEHVEHEVIELNKHLETLQLHIDAELGCEDSGDLES